MTVIILILLGVACEVVKANAWIVLPDFVSYILFGLGGVIFLINIINYFSTKRQINKIDERFKRW